MKIEVAPIIHSRTKYVDFNQNIVVCPEDIDVGWALSKIKPSMRGIAPSDKIIRHIVAKKDDLCIVGISGNALDFVKGYVTKSSPDVDKYFREVHGRKILMFIGYVFKGKGVPNIDYNTLWSFFERHMSEIWDTESPAKVPVEYKLYEIEPNAPEQPKGGEELSKVKVYVSDEEANKKIWKWCIYQKIDFCSNVDLVKILDDGQYKIVTSSQSFISSLKNKEAELRRPKEEKDVPQNLVKPQKEDTVSAPRQLSEKKTQAEKNPHVGKNPSEIGSATLIVMILLVVAIFVAIVVLIMDREPKQEDLQSDAVLSMNLLNA